MAELNRVRTGPTSYLKLNDEDLKAWKAAGNKEYAEAPADEPVAKAADKPAENKAKAAPAEKKQA